MVVIAEAIGVDLSFRASDERNNEYPMGILYYRLIGLALDQSA